MRFKNVIFCCAFLSVSVLLLIGCSGVFGIPDDSPFGVCVDLNECKDVKAAEMIKAAGIKWVRHVVRWDLVEPEKGEFRWSDLDKAVDNECSQGLNVYGQLILKSWCDPTTGDDKAIGHWADFVALTVARYKDRIKYWEVWNEEDYDGFWNPPSAANYVKLLKATYIAAKKIDPECKIILGGLMGWGGEQPYFPFIDEVYKNGGKDYFDIAAFHPYTMPYSPSHKNLIRLKIEDFTGRMRKNGDADKPVWITELGWPSNKLIDPASKRGVSPGQQAEYLTEAFRIALLYPQVKKVFWYGFRDTGTQPFDSENHFGLIENDFTPKPSYIAYKGFIAKWKKAD
ncbi:MAG: beta-galactosidase [Candidatus Omnitrophica bacterium]|nr:beta-galactosidase [Candidatus Omnitrophota bacterium]